VTANYVKFRLACDLLYLSRSMRARARRILRTGTAGALAAVADVLTLIALVDGAGLRPGPAAFLAASIGAVFGFTLSKYWAFRDYSALDRRQVSRYAMVSLFNAALVAFAVHMLADVVGVQYLWAKGVSAVLVFAVWSYPAQSRIVFRRPAGVGSPSLIDLPVSTTES
jgi:putative flippase GtrA